MQILILYGVLDTQKLLEDGQFAFFLSLATALLNLVFYVVIKYLRMKATGESFTLSTLEGMTANTSWLPYQIRLKQDQDDAVHMGIL